MPPLKSIHTLTNHPPVKQQMLQEKAHYIRCLKSPMIVLSKARKDALKNILCLLVVILLWFSGVQ